MTSSSEPDRAPAQGGDAAVLPDERATQAHIVMSSGGWLREHGDSPEGVGWTRPEQAPLRYRTMLDLLAFDRLRSGGDALQPVDVLDFGCGLAHLYDHLQEHPDPTIRYTGLDLSAPHLALARERHPELEFLELDVLSGDEPLPRFDYVVMNGILTWKNDATHEQMWAYVQRLLRRVFGMARRGIAFNIMSTHLDWQRDDLFHLPFDDVAAFVRAELSHHFVIRQDYGLFEYTMYVYRDAAGERDVR